MRCGNWDFLKFSIPESEINWWPSISRIEQSLDSHTFRVRSSFTGLVQFLLYCDLSISKASINCTKSIISSS